LKVYPNGEVCISILHPPGEDPNRYETSDERWSPVQSIEKILISVMSMLAEPNDESPANIEAAVCALRLDHLPNTPLLSIPHYPISPNTVPLTLFHRLAPWKRRKCGEAIRRATPRVSTEPSGGLWV